MRGKLRAQIRAVLLAVAATAVTLSVCAAQPPSESGPAGPRPHPVPISMPTFAPVPAAFTPSPSQTAGSKKTPRAAAPKFHSLFDDVLGPREHRVGPALPPMNAGNTIYVSPGQTFSNKSTRRRMSVSGSITVTASTAGSCSGAVGTIYNVNCQVSWQVINIDHTTYLHQDYFIDASGANADTDQTIGSTYQPSACSNAVSATGYCGPTHNQTLSNAGVYVLASAVCNNTGGSSGSACGGIAYWETVEYIVVTTSSTSIKTYSDAGQTIETTNYFVPSSGTTNVYILVNGLTVNDLYVVYIEATSYLPQCVYLAPFGSATASQEKNQLCDPNTVTGFKANQLSGSLTWPVGTSTSPGTYSIVVFDQTAQKRVAQRQISIDPASGSGNAAISLTPVAGPVTSPTPDAQTTAAPAVSPAPPMQRFAFDNPAEASDSGLTVNLSGLSYSGSYAFNVSDPNGYTAPVNFTNFNASAGGAATVNFTFDATTEPQNYRPNTYTISAIRYGTSNIVGSAGFQIVGYSALTQFTDVTGSSVLGTALTIAKSSTTTGGVQFINNGDSVYGASNGDALRGIFFTTKASGISLLPACGTSCVVNDSAGNQWQLTIATTNGNGTNANTDLLLLPVSSSTTLANGQSITIPNITFSNTAGNSGCQTGCQGYTQVLPVDGRTWSAFNSSAASNPVYFTNSAGNTYAATASMTHLGTVPTGTGWGGAGSQSGYEPHGYQPSLLQQQTVSGTNFVTQALYALNEPYNATSGTSDAFSFTVTNNSSQGGGGAPPVTFTGLEITFPADYIRSGSSTTLSVDPNSPTKWAKVTSGTGVPGACANVNVICLATTGGNAGIAGGGGVQTVYVDVTGLPAASFVAEEITVQAYNPASVPASPAVSGITLPAGAVNPYTIDALAVAAYSLDGSLMSGYISPSSIGTSTNYPATFTIKNTATGQDPNPDYLDAIVIDDPSNVLSGGSLSTTSPNPAPNPAGWSLLASKSDGSGGTLYWFGVCAGNYNWSDGPPTAGQPPVNPSLPQCSTASSEYNSIAPGGSFTFTANAQGTASAGTITFKMWAHGANVDGWSNVRTIPLTVTPISAVSGFSNSGGASLPGSSITQPNEPALSGDSSASNGNAFTYIIKNTSATGASNNITSAQITLPYQTDTGSAGYDSAGVYWTLEPSTPSIAVNLISSSGSSSPSGCTVAYLNPSNTGNGYIKLSGCTLQPGQTWQVQFYMKMPYLPNSEFQFPASVNNNTIQAAENWSGDTYVKLLLGASLVVTADPTPDPGGGGNPAPFCAPCTYTVNAGGTPEVNFGTVLNLGSATGTDVVMIQAYTDAASPYGGWQLYQNIDQNPANTGAPTNEFLSEVDSAHSTQGAGVTYANTGSYTVMPTSSPGMLIASTTSSNPARRMPFDIVTSYQVNINGGTTSGQTRTVTYTFIPN